MTALPGGRASDVDSPLVTDTPLPFPQLCAKIHERINTFLEEKNASPRLKGVQEQTRISLQVIAKALDQYRYVVAAPRSSCRRNVSWL